MDAVGGCCALARAGMRIYNKVHVVGEWAMNIMVTGKL